MTDKIPEQPESDNSANLDETIIGSTADKDTNSDINIGDTVETQYVSTDFDFDEDSMFPDELDTRPALPGKRRLLQIYVPQETEPLTFFNPDRLVMGRGGVGIQLDVDLSTNYGWMLGVSRRHAEIVYEDERYYVADLGSTNGTFLNSTRLVQGERYPLESTDQIRMGHFLMIVQF